MGQTWSQWPVSLLVLPLTCKSLSVIQNKIQTVPIVKKEVQEDIIKYFAAIEELKFKGDLNTFRESPKIEKHRLKSTIHFIKELLLIH